MTSSIKKSTRNLDWRSLAFVGLLSLASCLDDAGFERQLSRKGLALLNAAGRQEMSVTVGQLTDAAVSEKFCVVMGELDPEQMARRSSKFDSELQLIRDRPHEHMWNYVYFFRDGGVERHEVHYRSPLRLFSCCQC